LGPGPASDKFGSATMAVMSEEKYILAVGILSRLELVQRGGIAVASRSWSYTRLYPSKLTSC
jgi:hypothetical protein